MFHPEPKLLPVHRLRSAEVCDARVAYTENASRIHQLRGCGSPNTLCGAGFGVVRKLSKSIFETNLKAVE